VASSGVDLGLWLLVWVVGEYHVKDHVTFGLLNTIMTQPCSCVNRGGCVGLITEFKIRSKPPALPARASERERVLRA
jgi:hypothetical protein